MVSARWRKDRGCDAREGRGDFYHTRGAACGEWKKDSSGASMKFDKKSAINGSLNQNTRQGNDYFAMLPILFGILTSLCFAVASLLPSAVIMSGRPGA
jgi:hypothetical protein